MNGLLILTVLIIQMSGSFSCFPRRTKALRDSYVPIGIQVLYHYSMQLRNYYPYKFTAFCHVGTEGEKMEDAASQIPLSADVCVDESLSRINDLLSHLRREAANRNVDDFQGFAHSILKDLEKTSQSTSIQQFHFVLGKLEKEAFENNGVRCKITQLKQDLENPRSKLHRNLLNVKPLNYLDWR